MPAPTIPALIYMLSDIFPKFISDKLATPNAKPVRLLVIDALAELFHSSNKTTTKVLVERSQNITEISALLHALVSKWNIAVLVLNEVVDAFDYGRNINPSEELEYREQSRWFSRAHSIPGEDRKEASLGLVWANQVNARIMLSRTGRRRHLDDVTVSKRQKLHDGSNTSTEADSEENQLTLIRRLSVIFSSVAAPISLDYVVTRAGISFLPPEESAAPSASAPAPVHAPLKRAPAQATPAPPLMAQIAPLDVGFAEDGNNLMVVPSSQPEEDEWEEYWASELLPQNLDDTTVDGNDTFDS